MVCSVHSVLFSEAAMGSAREKFNQARRIFHCHIGTNDKGETLLNLVFQSLRAFIAARDAPLPSTIVFGINGFPRVLTVYNTLRV